MNNTEFFYPRSRAEWRQWLELNHREVDSVWLIFFKKNSGVASLSYVEAVEEALCFGWIDSKLQRIDNLSHKQFFCKRKKDSFWSKINKERVEKLIKKGLMRDAGYEIIEKSKSNGYWNLFDDAENLILPDELISNLLSNLTVKRGCLISRFLENRRWRLFY